MRHDRAAYFSAARERISTLEELMLSELEAQGENRDAGWDTDTLLEEHSQLDPLYYDGVPFFLTLSSSWAFE